MSSNYYTIPIYKANDAQVKIQVIIKDYNGFIGPIYQLECKCFCLNVNYDVQIYKYYADGPRPIYKNYLECKTKNLIELKLNSSIDKAFQSGGSYNPFRIFIQSSCGNFQSLMFRRFKRIDGKRTTCIDEYRDYDWTPFTKNLKSNVSSHDLPVKTNSNSCHLYSNPSQEASVKLRVKDSEVYSIDTPLKQYTHTKKSQPSFSERSCLPLSIQSKTYDNDTNSLSIGASSSSINPSTSIPIRNRPEVDTDATVPVQNFIYPCLDLHDIYSNSRTFIAKNDTNTLKKINQSNTAYYVVPIDSFKPKAESKETLSDRVVPMANKSNELTALKNAASQTINTNKQFMSSSTQTWLSNILANVDDEDAKAAKCIREQRNKLRAEWARSNGNYSLRND